MLIKKLNNGAIFVAGYVAGFLVYYACKASARIVNFRKPSHRISPETSTLLKTLFAGMTLDNVIVISNAWLPAHIFNRSIEGMTFRNRIYIAHRYRPEYHHNLMLLIHEIVHVRQIRNQGETVFACKYGVQFLHNRGYGAGMPLEKEAYEFVERLRHKRHELM
ncbi:MAG: DUF4157 domain-containing protein [Bacteroidales bacterium]|nr:DUF4157 domain-containing protein [Bacteroidales bacterium]